MPASERNTSTRPAARHLYSLMESDSFDSPLVATEASSTRPPKSYRASVLGLLEGHWGALALGLLAVGVETIATLLEPWPIKVVLDTVIHAKALPASLSRLAATIFGTNSMAVLQLAVAAVVLIAIVGSAAGYLEKQCVTA